MMNDPHIDELIERYIQKTASLSEQQELQDWFYNQNVEEVMWADGDSSSEPDEEEQTKKRMLLHIQARMQPTRMQPKQGNVKRVKLYRRIAAAAAILLVAGAGLFFYTSRHLEGSAATSDLLANDIRPGSNKAILTLANGEKLSLTDAGNGALAKEAGVEITKTANGQVVYSSLPSGISPQRGERGVVLNTIETPKGGQYQVRLPDGSKVWLNAASKLTYPVSFHGREDRRVELSGEAYFEIEKDKNHPFKVKSNGQEVEVLGTHFNINSYTDEVSTKTTLLEGSVKVTPSNHPASLSLQGRGGKAGEGRGNTSLPTGISPQSGERGLGTVLKPGEQALLKNNKIKIQQADTEQALDWKNGDFIFKQESLEEIMKRVSRWYDIEVEYGKDVDRQQTFSGFVSRNKNISEVLKIVASTGQVKFKIEGKTIKITN